MFGGSQFAGGQFAGSSAAGQQEPGFTFGRTVAPGQAAGRDTAEHASSIGTVATGAAEATDRRSGS